VAIGSPPTGETVTIALAMTLRFTLSAAEAQAVQRRLLARQWHRWAFVAFCLLLALAGVLLASVADLVVALAAALVYAASTLLLAPRRMWQRHPLMRAEQVVTISDEGVTTQLATASSTVDWSYWSRITRVADAYVLEGEGRGYLLIPRRAFGSAADEQRFLELAGV
jgi:hypothetical protein